jgi:membrane dipeptidase
VIEVDATSRAAQLHREALVIDTHCDTLKSLLPDFPNPPTPHRARLGERSDTGHIDIPRLIEGGEPLAGDLGVLRMLHRLGIRMIGLTWYYRNALADGLWERRTKGGLTRFGVDVVAEMARLGMIPDVSHLTDEGFWDLLDVTNSPVIASHSNARAVCASPRNLTDEQITALAERGGVVGLNFSSRHVKEGGATVQDLVDHVDHIVELVGADYVGLGSDFDGTRTPPVGLEDASQHPNFTRELVARGYSDAEIMKILGANHLRVFTAVLR